MPEVNMKPIPQDEERVNIFDDAEATYWAKRFGCTRAQLEAAEDSFSDWRRLFGGMCRG